MLRFKIINQDDRVARIDLEGFEGEDDMFTDPMNIQILNATKIFDTQSGEEVN